MTDSGRRGHALWPPGCPTALADPARRERNVVAALLGYVALWTLYGVIAKSQPGRPLRHGRAVGPRRRKWRSAIQASAAGAWLSCGVWFAVFPVADWAYYLLAMAMSALALWIVWRLVARFLDGEKRVVGFALLTLVPFFNFHALKFN